MVSWVKVLLALYGGTVVGTMILASKPMFLGIRMAYLGIGRVSLYMNVVKDCVFLCLNLKCCIAQVNVEAVIFLENWTEFTESIVLNRIQGNSINFANGI